MNEKISELNLIFPTPVWASLIKNHHQVNEKMFNYIKKLESINPQGIKKSNILGWHSENFDLTRAGTGGATYPDLKAEFSSLPHERGTLSMARSADPNSANSQFFICLESAPHLDRQYTVFGKVIKGMEFVDLIKKGEGSNGEVSEPDKIISLLVK